MIPAPIVVAIPARNEAAHIGQALSALAAQPDAARRIAAVIVCANNCTDDTAAIARNTALPFPVQVHDIELPPPAAHIGHARRGATDAATDHLLRLGRPDGIIASTDADSRVTNDWLAALCSAFTPTVDAVCGAIMLDGPTQPGLARVRRDEADYAAAVARAECHLDPLPHDPWPRHNWSWGANFAVRARALIAVGGSPLVDLAEDRALHALLLKHDARIRHDSNVRVVTSARAQGRAPGGFADLLSDYAADPEALADFNLEPAATSWARAAARGAARRRWGAGPGFGAFWAEREAAMPSLARHRIAVRDLPAQARLLRQWLRAAEDRFGTPARVSDAGWQRPAQARR